MVLVNITKTHATHRIGFPFRTLPTCLLRSQHRFSCRSFATLTEHEETIQVGDSTLTRIRKELAGLREQTRLHREVMEKRLDIARAKLVCLKQDVANCNLTSDVRTLRGENARLAANHSGLEATYSRLKARISRLEANISGLEAHTSGLEADNSGLAANISNLKGLAQGIIVPNDSAPSGGESARSPRMSLKDMAQHIKANYRYCKDEDTFHEPEDIMKLADMYKSAISYGHDAAHSLTASTAYHAVSLMEPGEEKRIIQLVFGIVFGFKWQNWEAATDEQKGKEIWDYELGKIVMIRIVHMIISQEEQKRTVESRA
ncbi:hypothetical protein DFH27DRAFT_655198 [Peziza echinospora]|nr:hypothetical protein DFH27DRAFT_655198 [Peziza echinospora]